MIIYQIKNLGGKVLVGGISNCINGKAKSHAGYTFSLVGGANCLV